MPPIFRHNNSILINDYVDSCDKVPTMTAKNRDKTLIISQFEIVLSDNYPKPAKNDVIRAYSNSSTTHPFFSGYVFSVKQDYNNDQYIVTVISEFQKLQDLKITYDNLHTQLQQTTSLYDYCSSDNFGLPNVQVLYLIKQMMFMAGLNLIIGTALRDNLLEILTYAGDTYNMTVDELVLDENVVYALNQSYALNKIGIIADVEKQNLVLSCFDFISEFCSHFNAHIFLVSYGFANWYQIDIAGPTTPAHPADKIYQKNEEQIIGEVGGYVHNLKFCGDRNLYNIPSPSDLQDHEFLSGNGNSNIHTINNLIYMYRKTSSMGGQPGDVLGQAYPIYCYDADQFLQNKIKAITGNFKETTLVIDNYLPTSANLTQLDMEREETELLWSEYVGGVSE